MKTRTYNRNQNQRYLRPLFVAGLFGLLFGLFWLGAGTTAYAQDGDGGQEGRPKPVAGDPNGDHEPEGTGEGPDPQGAGQPPGPQVEGGECVTRVLGRVPSGPDDFTPDERQRVVAECFGGGGPRPSSGGPGPGSGGPGFSGQPPGAVGAQEQCIVRVLGRIPAGPQDISPQEQLRIAQECLGRGGPGGPGGGSSGAGNLPDPRTLECVTKVLGRVPQGPDDITNEERRLVGQQCFGGGHGGPGGPGGSGGLSDEDLQCITNTIGRLPQGPDDLNDDEKRLLGRACFADDHRGGQGGPGGPGGRGGPDLDDETFQCIQNTLGRLPSGPDDLTQQEKRLIGQACFGGQRGPRGSGPGGGGPGDITDEELQCITDTIGRIPTGPDDLTDQEKILLGQTCFAGHGGSDGPSAEELQCFVDTIGRLPTGPDDMTEEEKRLVGPACFAGRGGADGPSAEEIQCIIATIGRMPSGPDDLTQEEKRLIGRACFADRGHEGPDDLDAETRQCIVNIVGYLPDSPGELTAEQLDLVIQECFEGELRSRSGSRGRDAARGRGDLDAETRECIIGLVGRLPTGPDDLTGDEKRLIGQQCFRNERRGGRGGGPTPISTGLSEETKKCITNLLGRVPTSGDDVSDEEKVLIAQECFQRKIAGNIDPPLGADAGGAPEPSPSSGGGTAAADNSQPSSGPAPAAASQPAPQTSGGQGASGGQQPAAVVAPAPQPALVLTQAQQDIQQVIKDYNEVPEMGVSGVIDRIGGLKGSKTAGIVALATINHLLIKGKDVTDEEWEDAFEALEDVE